MKKFVLNALNILGLIGEIYTMFWVVIAVIGSGFIIFVLNPEARNQFSAGFVKAATDMGHNPHIVPLFLMSFALGFIEYLVIFFLIRYARLLVKNLKNEIYFAKENLALLKKLLISTGVYAILEVIGLLLASNLYPMLKNVKINPLLVNPFPSFTAVLFLAIFYVVYLVFKYGLQLQEDSNSII